MKFGFTAIAIILIISIIVGGWLWTYSINSWLVYAGKTPSIKFWQGALIGCVPYIGQLSIPIAVGTWIALKIIPARSVSLTK
jgi:hypothetical protein